MSNPKPAEKPPRGWGGAVRPLADRILLHLSAHPGDDDVQIATTLGEVPFVVSTTLRKLERQGYIARARKVARRGGRKGGK